MLVLIEKINYNAKYKIVIYAYDKLSDSIAVLNPYIFTYSEPTFSEENNLVMNNDENYKLIINGNLHKKNYLIRISDNGYKLVEEKLTTNEYMINKKYYKDLEQKLDIEIIDGITSIDKITLYNKMSPISNIVIKTPENDSTLNFNDVTLIYEGGENATKYLIQIYKDNHLIKEAEVKKNKCIISAELFEKAANYKIKINAMYKDYNDYTKSGEVQFKMNEKDTLKPVYLNVSPKYIKLDTKLIP